MWGMEYPDLLIAVSGFLVLWSVYWTLGSLNLYVHMAKYPGWVFERKLQPKALFSAAGNNTNPPLTSFVVYLIVSHLVFVLPSMFVLQYLSRVLLVRTVVLFDRILIIMLNKGTGVQHSNFEWPGLQLMAWQLVVHGLFAIVYVEVFQNISLLLCCNSKPS
jgi:hypothetical protein